MNDNMYPRSDNLQVRLDFPSKMKDVEKTLGNVQKWDDFIKKMKDEMKKKIIKQGEGTTKFLQEEKYLDFLHDHLIITTTKCYVTWFSVMEGVTTANPITAIITL
jgi:hypothetical protein